MKKFLAVITVVVAVMVGWTAVQTQVQAQTGAAPGGINGKWLFVLDTPGGDRDVDANFTVDADGKITGTFGKDSAVGTFKDGKLELGFQMTAEETGETSQMKVTGKLDDTGAITGTWQFSAYDGTFKATHPKQ